MDYTLLHIERMADELLEEGVSIPGRVRSLPSAAEVPQDTEITTSKSSRSSVYLPKWLYKQRYDPAVTVTITPCRAIITKWQIL